MGATSSGQHDPARYEIRIQGHLGSRWTAWFDGMTMSAGSHGTTLLQGLVVDQAALHGLLSKLRDIGLPLVSVTRVDTDAEASPPRPPNTGPGTEGTTTPRRLT